MKILRRKIRCPKCKGSGRVYDPELGVFTFGIGTILQTLCRGLKDICPQCDGEGWIYEEIEIIEK